MGRRHDVGTVEGRGKRIDAKWDAMYQCQWPILSVPGVDAATLPGEPTCPELAQRTTPVPRW